MHVYLKLFGVHTICNLLIMSLTPYQLSYPDPVKGLIALNPASIVACVYALSQANTEVAPLQTPLSSDCVNQSMIVTHLSL